MEEYLTKKVVTKDIDDFIKLESIFDYQLVNKDIRGYKTLLSFKRETETPYYQEIVELEKSWNKEMNFPAWPTYVFITLSLLCITAYLIIFIISGLKLNFVYFLSIMLPGLIFFVLASIYFYIRTKKIQKILSLYYEKRREYLTKSNNIKEKYKK